MPKERFHLFPELAAEIKMRSMALFVTLGLAEDPEKAGFPREQAGEVAAALRDRLQEKVATRNDIEGAVTTLRAEFHKEPNAMAWKMAGLLLVQAGVVATLVKLI